MNILERKMKETAKIVHEAEKRELKETALVSLFILSRCNEILAVQVRKSTNPPWLMSARVFKKFKLAR
jgi:hypothetical protein